MVHTYCVLTPGLCKGKQGKAAVLAGVRARHAEAQCGCRQAGLTTPLAAQTSPSSTPPAGPVASHSAPPAQMPALGEVHAVQEHLNVRGSSQRSFTASPGCAAYTSLAGLTCLAQVLSGTASLPCTRL